MANLTCTFVRGCFVEDNFSLMKRLLKILDPLTCKLRLYYMWWLSMRDCVCRQHSSKQNLMFFAMLEVTTWPLSIWKNNQLPHLWILADMMQVENFQWCLTRERWKVAISQYFPKTCNIIYTFWCKSSIWVSKMTRLAQFQFF